MWRIRCREIYWFFFMSKFYSSYTRVHTINNYYVLVVYGNLFEPIGEIMRLSWLYTWDVSVGAWVFENKAQLVFFWIIYIYIFFNSEFRGSKSFSGSPHVEYDRKSSTVPQQTFVRSKPNVLKEPCTVVSIRFDRLVSRVWIRNILLSRTSVFRASIKFLFFSVPKKS